MHACASVLRGANYPASLMGLIAVRSTQFGMGECLVFPCDKESLMASLEERFQKGLEMRARLGGGQGRIFRGAVASADELAPDMDRVSTQGLYGSIWSRPGLDIKYRAMATLTVAAIQLAPPQVRAQVRNALNVGITPEEIIEILMMVAFYGGIPAAYNAMGVAKEVFEDRDLH